MMQKTEAEIFELYDIIGRPWWQHAWARYIIIALGALISIWLLRKLWKYIRKPKPLTVEQQVLLGLQTLKNGSYEHEYMLRDAYFDLTKLLKQYMSHRYQTPLWGKTEQELLEWFRTSDVEFEPFPTMFFRAYGIKYEGAPVFFEELQKDIALFEAVLAADHTKTT